MELTLGGSTTNLDVTLTPAETQDNDYPFSIINDIQAELDPAESRVKVSFSNGALTFSTLDGSAIAVSNVTGTATNELGIVAGSGNSDDLLIKLRDGTSHRVAFDSGDTTIQDIIDAIESATTVAGTRCHGGDQRRRQRPEPDRPHRGRRAFKVEVLNNSTAGLLLGIVRQDSSGARARHPTA